MAAALAVIFLFGLAVGSFLNVVILRQRAGESLGGRSRCTACRTTLTALDLIPVVSYLIQRGQCRHCGSAFSIQYPLVELATALGFTLAWWRWGSPLFPPSPEAFLPFVAAAVAIAAAIAIAVSDFRYQTIPDGPTVILFLVGAGASTARVLEASRPAVLAYDWGGAAFAAACLAILWLVSAGKWMGLGDVKLVLATSLAVGFPESLVAILFAFWLGGLWGAVLVTLRKRTLRSRIAFGPFILAGALLSHLFSKDFFVLVGLAGFIPL